MSHRVDSGGRPFTFDLGGLAVRLESQDHEWLELAAERFEAFQLARTAADIRIIYRVTSRDELDARALWHGRQQPIDGKRLDDAQGERLEITGHGFSARIGPEDVEIAGPAALYPLDLVLRVLYYEHLESALVVHSAALATARRGCLCTGPSGSGKSTLAGLFPHSALCDELAAVFWRGDEPWVAALPYWHGRPGQAPLQAVHLLVHGKSDRRRRLATQEACARLRQQIVWPSWDPDAMTRALESFARLVEQVPIHQLSFRPRVDVWPLLALEAA